MPLASVPPSIVTKFSAMGKIKEQLINMVINKAIEEDEKSAGEKQLAPNIN